MADQERRRRAARRSDAEVAWLLAELGPLLRRQARAAAAEPDPPFARPDPTFERTLRARLVGEAVAETVEMRQVADRARGPRRAHRAGHVARAVVWCGVAAALLVVVALVAVSVVALGVVVVALVILAIVVLFIARRR